MWDDERNPVVRERKLSEALADANKRAEGLLRELDEEREKTALLMQPTPVCSDPEFPWAMMRLWLANRDEEKRAHREALDAANKRAETARDTALGWHARWEKLHTVVEAARQFRKDGHLNPLLHALDALDAASPPDGATVMAPQATAECLLLITQEWKRRAIAAEEMATDFGRDASKYQGECGDLRTQFEAAKRAVVEVAKAQREADCAEFASWYGREMGTRMAEELRKKPLVTDAAPEQEERRHGSGPLVPALELEAAKARIAELERTEELAWKEANAADDECIALTKRVAELENRIAVGIASDKERDARFRELHAELATLRQREEPAAVARKQRAAMAEWFRDGQFETELLSCPLVVPFQPPTPEPARCTCKPEYELGHCDPNCPEHGQNRPGQGAHGPQHPAVKMANDAIRAENLRNAATEPKKCGKCGGYGKVEVRYGVMFASEACPECGGSGEQP
jgi:hypothetical protein